MIAWGIQGAKSAASTLLHEEMAITTLNSWEPGVLKASLYCRHLQSLCGGCVCGLERVRTVILLLSYWGVSLVSLPCCPRVGVGLKSTQI